MRSMSMPEPQPPHRELAQAEEGVRAGEGHAVVGADGLGQAELLEHPLEDGEGVDLLGGRQRLAAEQIAAGEVADGERVAVAAIGEHELAFVVGAPQVVGWQRPGQRRALRLVAALAATTDQAMAIEHRVHGADRRGLDVAVQAAQLLADLRRTPARVLPLELHDQLLDLEGQLVGLPVGPAAAIGQPVEPAILVALEDLVAGLARDIELAAQHRHLLAVEQPGHESQPLVHLVTLLPRHFALPQSAEVLPMCPE